MWPIVTSSPRKKTDKNRSVNEFKMAASVDVLGTFSPIFWGILSIRSWIVKDERWKSWDMGIFPSKLAQVTMKRTFWSAEVAEIGLRDDIEETAGWLHWVTVRSRPRFSVARKQPLQTWIPRTRFFKTLLSRCQLWNDCRWNKLLFRWSNFGLRHRVLMGTNCSSTSSEM